MEAEREIERDIEMEKEIREIERYLETEEETGPQTPQRATTRNTQTAGVGPGTQQQARTKGAAQEHTAGEHTWRKAAKREAVLAEEWAGDRVEEAERREVVGKAWKEGAE